MTDLPSSPDDNDAELLASLYVDGEANADERSRVEADPELMALVETYRAQATALADVTPPPELRATQLEAALDVFDSLTTTSATANDTAAAETAEAAGVVSLADGRRRRDQRRTGGLPSWLGAAAALALVVGGLGFVASNLGSSDDDSGDASEVALNPSSGTRSTEDGDDSDAMEAEMLAEPELAEDAASVEMSDETVQDDAMEDDEAMEESGADEEAATGDAAPTTTTVPAIPPVVLDDLVADTAAGYLAQIVDVQRQDTGESACADAVSELGTPDGFISVVFDGEAAELHVLAPEGAVIVSRTCEVVLS